MGAVHLLRRIWVVCLLDCFGLFQYQNGNDTMLVIQMLLLLYLIFLRLTFWPWLLTWEWRSKKHIWLVIDLGYECCWLQRIHWFPIFFFFCWADEEVCLLLLSFFFVSEGSFTIEFGNSFHFISAHKSIF